MNRMCSFTVTQGDREWQQWDEIPAKEAAKCLYDVVCELKMFTSATYFTTTTTHDPNVNQCCNRPLAVPGYQAINELVEIIEEWEKEAQSASHSKT